MIPQVFTFCDAVLELENFARSSGRGMDALPVRAAIRRAYREILSAHDWSFLLKNHRLPLVAEQKDGTVAYDHTGGTYERQLTLTDNTWPSDAIDWAVRIDTGDDEVVCDIETRESDTVVTLALTMNPGADVAAGASYVAYPRYYRLPNDFLSMDRPVEQALSSLGEYKSFQELMELECYTNDSGDIRYYAIAQVPDLFGTMGVFVYPHGDTARSIDFTYKRRGRDLRFVGTDLSDSPGTIAVTAGSAAVTGTGTNFTSVHVGSLLRIGDSASKVPTGIDGLLPYVEQRTITARTSTTAITLDNAVASTASGMKYSITDPIDLDAVVYDAMMSAAKRQIAIERDFNNWRQIAALADEALLRAKCGDSRVTQRRVAGAHFNRRVRLADSPTANRYEVE